MFLWTSQDFDVLENMTCLGIINFHRFLYYVFGSGLVKMLLWTVGSFSVFGEKCDLTCVLLVRFVFKKPDFPDDCIFAKLHHAEGGQGFYFFEITMWENLVFLCRDST